MWCQWKRISDESDEVVCKNCGISRRFPRIRNCPKSPALAPAAARLGLTLDKNTFGLHHTLTKYAAGQPLGPGDWLHVRLLQLVGEGPTHSCGCENRIAQCNAWGPAGCREHLSEIVDWLREQANNKGWWKYLNKLPGARWAVERIVLWAIAKSEDTRSIPRSSGYNRTPFLAR